MFRILNQLKNSKYSKKPPVFLRSLPNKLIKFLSKTKKNSGILGAPGPDRQEQEKIVHKEVTLILAFDFYSLATIRYLFTSQIRQNN